MASAVLLGLMLLMTLADSVHFRRALPDVAGGVRAFDTRTESVLDIGLAKLIASRENSYSQPLATYGFSKESVPPQADAKPVLDEHGVPTLPARAYPRLRHGGAGLADAERDWAGDIAVRLAWGSLAGAAVSLLLWLLVRPARATTTTTQPLAWRAAWITASVMAVLVGWGVALSWGQGYHVFGTDRTGNDVLYMTLKSIRTAFVIGSLATMATLPFALILGIAAGYFKGWVDDVIQYIYTVLSSVPNMLLIAACVLMVQVFLDKHPELFETGPERADLKIFLLCLILGLTGWAGLCRCCGPKRSSCASWNTCRPPPPSASATGASCSATCCPMSCTWC
jgi:peptide/nickel transport system permease protein